MAKPKIELGALIECQHDLIHQRGVLAHSMTMEQGDGADALKEIDKQLSLVSKAISAALLKTLGESLVVVDADKE